MNTSESNQVKLQKKFKAIEAALAVLNRGWKSPQTKDRLYISVQRASRNLLQVSPELTDGNVCSLVHPGNESLLGWRTETYFAVDDDHQILDQLGTFDRETKHRELRQVKHLVQQNLTKLRYVIQVTVTGWCHRILNREFLHNPALGVLEERQIQVTVYRDSDGSFQQLMSEVSSDASLRLHFGAALFGMDTDDPNVLSFMTILQGSAAKLKEELLVQGFLDMFPLWKTISEKLGDVEVSGRRWNSGGGRANLDLDFTWGQTKLSFVYDIDDGFLRLSGMDGTIGEALGLIEVVLRGWKSLS